MSIEDKIREAQTLVTEHERLAHQASDTETKWLQTRLATSWLKVVGHYRNVQLRDVQKQNSEFSS